MGQLWASLAKPGQPRFENSPAFPRRGKVGRETEQKREKPVCDPVCDFEARVGKRHQKNGFPALLGPCGADVDEFRDSGKPG